MHMHIGDAYWFNDKQIGIIQEKYNAKYMGYWCTKRNGGGSWNEVPVDVFYVENPDTSKGHTNFFGMFRKGENVLITDASSCFSVPMTGILTKQGEVVVSRFRHDYRGAGDGAIDGGRDYTKLIGEACHMPKIKVTVENGNFVFEQVES